MWMGLITLSSISSQQSRNCLYPNEPCTVMSRNIFQIRFKNWHLCDNENIPENEDNIQKVRPLLSILQHSFQKPIPGELCMDFGTVQRTKFKQHIANNKFGIKSFKLCYQGEYLYDLRVYCGQERSENENHTFLALGILTFIKTTFIIVFISSSVVSGISYNNFFTHRQRKQSLDLVIQQPPICLSSTSLFQKLIVELTANMTLRHVETTVADKYEEGNSFNKWRQLIFQ